MVNDTGDRPYFHYAISQLSDAYENAATDDISRNVIRELEHRQSASARRLLSDIRSGIVKRQGTPSKPINQPNRKENTSKGVGEIAFRQPSNSGQLKLTQEQSHAVTLFQTRQNVRINAFAGTGKTTTLQAMAESRKDRGIYLAFNRAIADNAGNKFPRNVRCQTVHSLAFAFARGQLKREDKLTDTVNCNLILRALQIQPYEFTDIQFNKGQIAAMVANVLKQFFHSGDYDITSQHFQSSGILSFINKDELGTFVSSIIEHARTLWLRMITPSDPLPLGHDGYLKYWALCRPKIEADFILLDEAQDTNPVVLEVLKQQSSQVVFVGDRYQQIYEWRGAINAMESANATQNAYLTESFRFGPNIAAVANRLLARLQESRTIIGVGRSVDSQRPSKAIISRTNAALVDSLIHQLASNERPYLEGGTSDLKRLLYGVQQLMMNKPSDLPELFGFRDWKSFVAFANSDQGIEYRTLVRLIGRYSIQKLLEAIDRSEPSETRCTVTLSTTHRAKGREWDDVTLAEDFKRPDKDVFGSELSIPQEELRICYVAVTRARQKLRIPESIENWI